MSILSAVSRLPILRMVLSPSWSLLATLLPLVATPAAMAAPPAPPTVVLPDAGISNATSHPNLLLDLSVEFPTVGRAYRGQAYDAKKAYIGYFDSSGCYAYTVPATYVGGVYSTTADGNRYFKPAGAADVTHRCSGNFSGNFMNWATASAIDVLRLSLTGGNRVIDKVGNTVLERAVLPVFFNSNSGLFPVATLAAAPGLATQDVTPFSVPVLYVTSCRNRVLFSTSLPFDRATPLLFDDGKICDAQTNPDKSLGEFVVKVEVCSDTEGPARPGLCHKYGPHYKPEGEIHKYADKVRFAAFGYLFDKDLKRYGGVLRAPMKYVGPTSYDLALQPLANPNAEWKSATGVFDPDPVPDGTGTSGVINYLNKFGQTGDYKLFDPIGELFYESIRYLQGLPPTPEAITGITPAMKDGFPVITSWADPIQASCQKNSVLLIGDAHTHYEFYIPGNTRTATQTGNPGVVADGPRPVDATSSPPLDIMAFTHRIGVMETSTHGVDMTTRPQLANLENQSTGWKEGGTFEGNYYLAGVTYWANTSELRPLTFKGINAQTYVIDVDEGGSGVVTDSSTRPFTHPRDTQLYLAAKYGGFRPLANVPAPYSPTDPFWPLPSATSPKQPSGCYPYLWDPGANCDPPNYLLASDGGRFSQALKTVFAAQDAPGEAVTQVGASSTTVTEGTSQYIYQGKYMTPGWGGDLRRLPVSYVPATGLVIGAADSKSPLLYLKEPDWPVPAPGPVIPPRKIYTLNSTATSPANSTIPFDWVSLTAAQKAMLDGTDTLGQARLHYLRGSINDEVNISGGHFRQRLATVTGGTNILGDIVHSNPVYVGAPATSVQGSGYQAFHAAHATRPAAVYVGANDGMLHAFNADLTQEYFAYVPGMLFPVLPALTQPDYIHRPYVDGGISVAEAKVNGTWKTVLASAMGGGAQGIFALDVTAPQNFSPASGALWEFTDANDPDMGNVFSPPTIAKFTKSVAGGVPVYQYFVVVSSGLNNYAADGAAGTAPGGALFLLSLDKAAGTPWLLNSNYFKFPIPTTAINASKRAGLSAPALVTSNDGAVRVAYAGDLQGNLWRFAFPVTAAIGSTTAYKLFTANDAAGNLQAITTPPSVVFAPDAGYMVLFGTGKYLENTDIATAIQDSMYGILDTLAAGYTVSGRTQLAPRTLGGSSGAAQVTLSGAAFSYTGASAKRGWFFDFIDPVHQRERVVAPPQLAFGRVIFNTLLPPPATLGCPVPSSGRSYSVNSLNGLDGASGNLTGTLSTAGILSPPMIFTTRALTAAAVVPNATGIQTVPAKYSIASVGGTKVAPPVNQSVNLTAGRLNWREIFNYQGF